MTYKDKDDALAEYTSKMSGNADATMSALDGQNPLPASFAIEMDDPSQVESTAKKLKKDADFQKIADDGDVNASVLYGQEEVSRPVPGDQLHPHRRRGARWPSDLYRIHLHQQHDSPVHYGASS